MILNPVSGPGHQLARQRHHVLYRARELLAAMLQRFCAVAFLIVEHLLQY